MEDPDDDDDDDDSFIASPSSSQDICDSDGDYEEEEETHQQEPPLKKQRRAPPVRSSRKAQKSVYDVLFVQGDHDGDDDDAEQSHQDDDDDAQEQPRRRCSEKFKTLMREIIEMSQADTWMDAKEEWDPYYVYYEHGGTCLCTHTPITEHCVINNRKNKKVTTVGNVCIRQFNTKHLKVVQGCWGCLRRLSRNPAGHRANKSLLRLAKNSKILRQSQIRTYLALTTGKGSRNRFNSNHPDFEPDDYAKREIENKRILYGFNPQRPQCLCRPEFPAIPCYSPGLECFFYSCWNRKGRNNPGCGFWTPAPPLSEFNFETPENSDADDDDESERIAAMMMVKDEEEQMIEELLGSTTTTIE